MIALQALVYQLLMAIFMLLKLKNAQNLGIFRWVQTDRAFLARSDGHILGSIGTKQVPTYPTGAYNTEDPS